MFTFSYEICATQARWPRYREAGARVKRARNSEPLKLKLCAYLGWPFLVHWRNKIDICIRILDFVNCFIFNIIIFYIFIFYNISAKLSETTEFLSNKTEGICLKCLDHIIRSKPALIKIYSVESLLFGVDEFVSLWKKSFILKHKIVQLYLKFIPRMVSRMSL